MPRVYSQVLMMSACTGLTLANRCEQLEDCVYSCGTQCSVEILQSDVDKIAEVDAYRSCLLENPQICEEGSLASEYSACIETCQHDAVVDEYDASCHELSSDRCYRYTYSLPYELLDLSLECEWLLQIRNECLAVNEEFDYNVTSGEISLKIVPVQALEPRARYAGTSERQRLGEALRDPLSADSEHLDELIFVLDLYCWGDVCDGFAAHADFYESFTARFGMPGGKMLSPSADL